MQIGLVLRGNAFAVILRDIHGNPEALVPLNPDRVALWETPNGSLFYAVTRSGMHEQFVLRDQPFLIPYRDMFHLKSLSTNGLMGFSPIAVARESVGLALAQEQQAARWMGQASRPSGILTTDQALTEEAAKRMSEDWRAIQSGVQNSGRTAILEQGLKFQALTLTAADVDFFRAREFQVQEIARLFRVPIAMLTEVGSSSRVDPDILAQHYYNHTLSSHVNIWAARFNVTFDLWESNLRVEFDASKILEADMSRRIDMHRSAVNGGLETQNEGRRGIGLDPVEGGDVLLLPGNSVPFGSDKSGDAPIGAGRPTAAGAQNPDQPGAGA